MKALFLPLLFLSSFVFAQSDLPLGFTSAGIRLNVAKDESLVMASRAGEIGIAAGAHDPWRRADLRKNFNSLEQPVFFNRDTGIITGYLQDSSEHGVIYRTTDGGLNWNAVRFGKSEPVDDATGLDNGEAWISVAGVGIGYTMDYGLSWKMMPIPEVRQRFQTIYFNTKREGLIGSLWNMIAYTQDNCRSWKLLPSPLDQKKYSKTDRASRPSIDRVAIYKDYLLVLQEGMVFARRQDTTDWTLLPEYTDFYTDPENSALFFKTNKNGYVRAGDNFKPVFSFELQGEDHDAKCRNGKLFILVDDKLVRLDALNQVSRTPIGDLQAEAEEPEQIGFAKNGQIGFMDNAIWQWEGDTGIWHRSFSLPFPVQKEKLSVLRETVLYDAGDSLFYFDLSGDLVRQVSKRAMVEDFSKPGIKTLRFTQGSIGCFHYYEDTVEYMYMANAYLRSVKTTHKGPDEKMAPEDDAILEVDVAGFFAKIPELFDTTRLTTVADLAFTEKDYRQCKKDILDYKASLGTAARYSHTAFEFHRNNLDFDRLLRLVDSIKTISPQTLRRTLEHLSRNYSTTTNWKSIVLVNARGEHLSISNNYYTPNSFHFPWKVNLNGYEVQSTSIEIARFLQKVYPGFLGHASKADILHQLVIDLY